MLRSRNLAGAIECITRPAMASDVNAHIVRAHAASLARTSKLRQGVGENAFWCCPVAPSDHHNVENPTTHKAEAQQGPSKVCRKRHIWNSILAGSTFIWRPPLSQEIRCSMYLSPQLSMGCADARDGGCRRVWTYTKCCLEALAP